MLKKIDSNDIVHHEIKKAIGQIDTISKAFWALNKEIDFTHNEINKFIRWLGYSNIYLCVEDEQ